MIEWLHHQAWWPDAFFVIAGGMMLGGAFGMSRAFNAIDKRLRDIQTEISRQRGGGA